MVFLKQEISDIIVNLEYFIAKRIIDKKSYKSSISAPIIKIGIAAIAIGIIVMLIAMATGFGLQQKIRDKVIAFNGHVVIKKYDSNQSNDSESPISIQQDFYPDFKSVPEVFHIQAVATKSGIVRLENTFEYVVIKGVGLDYDWRYFKTFLVKGRLPDYNKKLSDEVLISNYLAQRLNFKIGDRFNTNFLRENLNKPPRIMTFKVVGIYDSGFKDYDQLFVIGDIKHVQRLNKWNTDQIGEFEVFIKDYDHLKETSLDIRAETPSDLNAVSVTESNLQIFEWISIFDSNTYGIIGIMIIIAGINMITALLVLILERTKMIGILKALGGSNTSIRKIFLYNAMYLILVGLFWGNLIGFLLLFTQKYFNIIPLDASSYYVDTVPVYLNIWFVISVNIGTFLLCLLMLLIPSVVISKISPVKAIQFD